MKYIIVKKKKHYHIIDTFFKEVTDLNTRITVYKNNKVYETYYYDEVDDWFADIGAITHTEKIKIYLGKLIFESDDIEETAREFVRLESVGV